MNQITKITICQELFEEGLSKSHIADKLGVNRETVRIWLGGIENSGLNGFPEEYLNCEKGERAKKN
ncbi:helix-turn-helix domain-containing protein [Candidatus Shapirobacteria bacterium]|nr:helix-turn-helix domain-containing protein [Candidatus Shapirobacteria bacterium]